MDSCGSEAFDVDTDLLGALQKCILSDDLPALKSQIRERVWKNLEDGLSGMKPGIKTLKIENYWHR
jgi:hypothetical protein